VAVDKFLEAALLLQQCLCDQMALLPLADQPQRCCVIAGQDFEMGVALTEDMCACGTAWVRIDSFTPSATFPIQQETPTNCGPEQWTLTLELGVARCPPLGDANVLPTCTEWADYTTKVMADAQAMRNAIICCFGPARPNRLYLIGGWQAFGPEGLCGGGKMTVQVQILRCNECP
jgi:hypothetical protein